MRYMRMPKNKTIVVVRDKLQQKTHRMHQVSRKSIPAVKCDLALHAYAKKVEPVQLFVTS